MGLIVPYVGGVEKRRKLGPTFSVSVRLWLHSDMYICVFFFNPEDIKGLSMGAIWNFSKGTGLP